MSKSCPDCGNRMYGGACTWCHEETYIHRQHVADPCCELSDEFLDTVKSQKKEIRKNRKAQRRAKFSERDAE